MTESTMTSLRGGTHRVGQETGSMQVRTYREGVAQKIGHDLIIDVGDWQATLEVSEDGRLSSIELRADPRSLQVREGLHGVKPLKDKDRSDIRKTIDDKILHGQPITFSSSQVEAFDRGLRVGGDLTLAGVTRSARFELNVADDGKLSATLPVVQSDWGIKPYRGLMGALKVRDEVEIVLGVELPRR